ncbi:hypothetical protein AB0J82_36495 [Asanoa sp. NPDC049518]|uniref:hypothetical protein n=1 Tax=unclassified Asanoa TaxID=2685164 RepID=UPI00344A1C54
MKERDEGYVFSMASNCRLWESDPDPALINIGSEREPFMVSRVEAFRTSYARAVLERLDADPQRLAAAEQYCLAELDRIETREYWIEVRDRRAAAGDPHADDALSHGERTKWTELWECARDLCHSASTHLGDAQILDERSRQKFLAALRHQNTLDVLGDVAGVAGASGRRLTQRLADLDD